MFDEGGGFDKPGSSRRKGELELLSSKASVHDHGAVLARFGVRASPKLIRKEIVEAGDVLTLFGRYGQKA